MPGWHERTEELVAAGKLRVFGIVEEQHGDRAALFQQWHEFDWPILVDAYNELGVEVVPITLFIDAHGVIRKRMRRPSELDELLAQEYAAPEQPVERGAPPTFDPPETQPLLSDDAVTQAPAGYLAWATSVAKFRPSLVDDALDTAIDVFERLDRIERIDGNADAGVHEFRLGVALRYRSEEPDGRANDFARAVAAWTVALDENPNQYIWRRRIQQYGPKLDKPYPFYDWVRTARAEVTARGETPVALRAPLTEAESLDPRVDGTAPGEATEPDPDARIARDDHHVRVEFAVAPSPITAGESARVHLEFELASGSHWNHEADPLRVWLEAPEGWKLDRSLVELPVPKSATTSGARRIEFEITVPEGFEPSPDVAPKIRGYALYGICDDEDATCRYVRRDFEVLVRVRPTR